MRILITGGSGFIGSHLAENLAKENHEVCTFDETDSPIYGTKNFCAVKGSILNFSQFREAATGFDLIIHLAGIAEPLRYCLQPKKVIDVNLKGSLNVLQTAIDLQAKIIFASTSEVYGMNPDLPWAENDKRVLGPTQNHRWCYASCKSLIEHYLFACQEQQLLDFVIVRFFNLYGPRLKGRVIDKFITNAIKNEPITIHNSGMQSRTFMYINDALIVLKKIIDSNWLSGEVYNIGTTTTTTIKELAYLIRDLCQSKSKIVYIDQKDIAPGFQDIFHRIPNVDKAKSHFNWEATTSIKEGLQQTIPYFKNRISVQEPSTICIDSIPLFKPEFEYNSCMPDILSSLDNVAQSGMYVNGPRTEQLEDLLGKFLQSAYVVGVSSGTIALELMIRAENICPGTEIVLTANTFVADLEAVLATGAIPSFIDIDPLTWQMPRLELPSSVLLVSHLYGNASPAIFSSAKLILEDASQGFGTLINNRYLGTWGNSAAISLHPTKNLSALGDAGIVITQRKEVMSTVKALRNHGQTSPQVHTYRGTTGRLDEFQAAVLIAKLKNFHSFASKKKTLTKLYQHILNSTPLELPNILPGCQSVTSIFVVRTKDRDNLRKFLKNSKIQTGIHYSTPLHRMPAYEKQPWAQVNLPETEKLCKEILTLPLWVGMSYNEILYVGNKIREYYGISKIDSKELHDIKI